MTAIDIIEPVWFGVSLFLSVAYVIGLINRMQKAIKNKVSDNFRDETIVLACAWTIFYFLTKL